MKFLLLGAGKMAKAIAYDLIHYQNAEKIILASRHIKKTRDLKKWLNSENIVPVEIDVKDTPKLIELMKDIDCVISAVSYQYNYLAALAAVKAGVNYCDLGQNVEIVDKEFTLAEEAKEKNITIIPDGGVAPGMVNIIAAHGIKNFDSVDKVLMRVGGLPQHPIPPLNYNVTWSVHGLINEYIEKARILRNGEFIEVDSLSELESITFHYPFNKMEAFITSGGSSTLPKTYEGKINELNYKTIRYSNHHLIMKSFIELGFTNEAPVTFSDNNFSPRKFFEKILDEKLKKDIVEDVILMRVTVSGLKEGERQTEIYELIDYYDPVSKLTAMMRTTGFSLAIVAGLIAKKQIKKTGVLTQEESIPTDIYLSELKKRGINVTVNQV
ncbi:MAG: saccharopine dehydrogenase NADP-binding domain-containing protein [Spirochaetia bacterium]|nr:saccharopine dehydrogenase NADP-binding domain-containing protein [Spirochaetia bacterium]